MNTDVNDNAGTNGAGEEQGETPAALFFHAKSVYDQMNSRSKLVELSELESDPTLKHSMLVYEGMLTRLITGDMHLSVPYYTSVTKALKGMGCIRQLRRGGGSSPSQWELLTEPTVELFQKYEAKDNPGTEQHKGGKVTQIEMLRAQISDMNARILKLEAALQAVMEGE